MKDKNDFSRKQQKYFNQVADHQKDSPFFEDNNATATEFATIIGLMKHLKDKKVLDLGCGAGRYSLRIAKFAKEVIGVDISEKSIDFANKIAIENNVANFKGVVFNYSNPIQEGYFDYILMVNVVHHTNDIDLMFENVYKSLKQDGSLIIFEFNPLNLLFVPFLIFIKQSKAHLNKAYFRSNIFSLRNILKRNYFDTILFSRYAFLPTSLYNLSMSFKIINMVLNKIPVINIFSAFHILECKKRRERLEN